MNAQLGIRSSTLFLDLNSTWGLISLSGPDRKSFLQALTTNDLSSLKNNFGQYNALLAKNATILADFWIYDIKDSFLIISKMNQIKTILRILNEFHFAEDVNIKDISDAKCLWALQNGDYKKYLPDSLTLPEDYIGEEATLAKLKGINFIIINHSLTGDPGIIMIFDNENIPAMKIELESQDLKLQTVNEVKSTLEILRLEAGIPEFGQEFTSDTLIMELGLNDLLISFDKGCFPGQEIVARIKSRGEVSKQLMGIIFAGKNLPDKKGNIYEGDTLAGQIVNCVYSPTLDKIIALAFLHKKYYKYPEYDFKFTIGNVDYNGTVISLPIYKSPAILLNAKKYYDAGMDYFHDKNWLQAKIKFARALEIYPRYADAYEAIAVTLEKNDQIDDAMKMNQKFAEIDPMATMAYANLSRLYMLKGMIEKAEDMQSKATALKFRNVARDGKKSRINEEQEKQQQKDELERKLNIFRQVLEMDIEDEIANFGIGKLYYDQGKYSEAEKHLQIVVDKNDKYSVAFDILTKSLHALGKNEETRKYLTAGINAAKSQGDMMPLKSMEELLYKL